MKSDGLFALHREISFKVPSVDPMTLEAARKGRPWIAKLDDASLKTLGTLQIARIIRADEESIDDETYVARLQASVSRGCELFGWSHAEWVLEKLREAQKTKQRMKRSHEAMRRLMLEEAVAIDFAGTRVVRNNGTVGIPSLVPDGGDIALHCSPLNWAFHRRVAVFVPEGVTL